MQIVSASTRRHRRTSRSACMPLRKLDTSVVFMQDQFAFLLAHTNVIPTCLRHAAECPFHRFSHVNHSRRWGKVAPQCRHTLNHSEGEILNSTATRSMGRSNNLQVHLLTYPSIKDPSHSLSVCTLYSSQLQRKSSSILSCLYKSKLCTD